MGEVRGTKINVLVDTNVWLDILADREPFYFDSKGAVMICVDENIDISVVATSLKDIFFLIDKAYDHEKAYAAIELILEIANVSSVDEIVCKNALKFERLDYEDGIAAAAAIMDKVDLILTRDTRAFERLDIPKLTPKDFIISRGYDGVSL